MIQLSKHGQKTNSIRSSKGNQMKWFLNNTWYKADSTGYEGLAEYMTSMLLNHSTLYPDEYVEYETELLCYDNRTFTGCKSHNFLPENWQLITLERLFHNYYQESLYKSIFALEEPEKRLEFLVDYVIRMTGLKDFGLYMSKLMTIDALFLNEDRHTHNIAVLLDPLDTFHYCPIFDNGAGLMADTSLDYPVNLPVQELFGTVSAKTFSNDFDIQLDTAEKLYGQHIKFDFSRDTIQALLKKETCYPDHIKERVCAILMEQRRKYQYLFTR